MKRSNWCENCKFFKRHYAFINEKFVQIACGHCSNELVSPRKRKRCPYLKNCKYFMEKNK